MEDTEARQSPVESVTFRAVRAVQDAAAAEYGDDRKGRWRVRPGTAWGVVPSSNHLHVTTGTTSSASDDLSPELRPVSGLSRTIRAYASSELSGRMVYGRKHAIGRAHWRRNVGFSGWAQGPRGVREGAAKGRGDVVTRRLAIGPTLAWIRWLV